jgi:S-DNA-T family DNA segregation ATPase FtsK/SpoIIIE
MAKRRVRSTRKKKRTGTRTRARTRQTQSKHAGGPLYEISGIILFIFGVMALLSLAGQSMGMVGSWLRDTLCLVFGMGAFVPALLAIWLGFWYMARGRQISVNRHTVLYTLLFIVILSFVHAWMVPEGHELSQDMDLAYGGVLGGVIVMFLRELFGGFGTLAVLAGAALADILLLTHWSLSEGAQYVEEKTEKNVRNMKHTLREKAREYRENRGEVPAVKAQSHPLHDFIFKKRKETNGEEGTEPENETLSAAEPFVSQPDPVPAPEPVSEPVQEPVPEPVPLPEDADDPGSVEPPVIPEERQEPQPAAEAAGMTEEKETGDREETAEAPKSEYVFPSLTLLKPGGQQSASLREDAEKKKLTLETTLKNFGVNARVINTSIGPSVTRFELEPAPGVKVKKIENLADDIALSLAATHLRIEAPIPGKSAVGIEVPNAKTTPVSLRDVLESSEFKTCKGDVCVALGKDIGGKTIVTDLARMPHLLIAGSTGSGKSVCINTLIMSILYRYRPEEVKMILIDPKVVELSVYNGVPHLLSPVVTSPKKAAGALKWAVKQMEARYELFSREAVRDIHGYNRLHPESTMPFLVIIIDELADLMMAAGDSVEDSICRLAQKARAAGIHLVLATQRPSVDVITGLIKANIPSRISFAVSSQVDSRTILDQGGAENLLGKGDMLFAPIGAQNMIRVQGAFVSDDEVESVTNFIKNEAAVKKIMEEEETIEFKEPEETEPHADPEEKDELLEEAIDWIMDSRKASVSMLQRRFRIGYTRAGRLMDTIEAMGIVGPSNGAKPREILMNRDEVREKYFSEENKDSNHG